MPTNAGNRVIQHLRRVALQQDAASFSDGELLEQYVAWRDEAAFEALLRRHGPMVLAVCRRVLCNEADAEDAFQATFLVLVRKAASIQSRAAVSNWLYGVASNVALKAKAMNRKRREKESAITPAPPSGFGAESVHEVQALLDSELRQLPDKYRVPLVLCDLEGKTIKEAASHLGWPQGTVATRVTRGRALLARRLAKRGVLLSGGALAAVLSQGTASASLPPALVSSTVKAAGVLAASPAAPPGVISPRVAALTEGVVRAMVPTRMKLVAALALLATAFATGAGALVLLPSATSQPGPKTADSAPKGERLTLRGWGVALDPADDCKFSVEKGKLTLTLPGSDHALCIEQNRMNAPRVLQEVEGDFILQVKVGGNYPETATSVVEKRIGFHGAGLLVWQDEKNYIRLEKAQLYSNETVRYISWELRKDGKFTRVGNTGDAPLDAKEVYLRIERRDGKLLGSFSSDGNQWTALEAIEVELTKKLQVGIVAGHNTSTGYAPEFSEFKLFRDAAK
jgi:RNA polymerase sigma factor (sigma-70 family)